MRGIKKCPTPAVLVILEQISLHLCSPCFISRLLDWLPPRGKNANMWLSLYKRERGKQNSGRIWSTEKPQWKSHTVACLWAAQLSLTGSQEQSDFCPPEERDVLCARCYAEKMSSRKGAQRTVSWKCFWPKPVRVTCHKVWELLSLLLLPLLAGGLRVMRYKKTWYARTVLHVLI